MKGKIYKTCVRVVVVYGEETWNVKTVEECNFSTERAMVRKMCGAKLVERKIASELMERFSLKETVVEVVNRSDLR